MDRVLINLKVMYGNVVPGVFIIWFDFFITVTEKLSESMNVIANEPSLAFFRIQEHVRKCLPQLAETKVRMLFLISNFFSNLKLVYIWWTSHKLPMASPTQSCDLIIQNIRQTIARWPVSLYKLYNFHIDLYHLHSSYEHRNGAKYGITPF